MEVVLVFRQGPLAGRRMEFELGQIAIGRDPGQGGVTLPGDDTVSRHHGDLLEQAGRVVYRNLSPNGTLVGRRIVQESEVLEPGTRIHLGSQHLVEVQFRPRPATAAATAERAAGLLRSGPLARPAVRVVLAAYLAGMVALGVFFTARGDTTLADQFAPVRRQYAETYHPANVPPGVLKARLARAERLVDEIDALQRSENWPAARAGYRELMALDGDPASPFYRFAARQLGEIARRR